ncbi:hypothetical protein QL093DRAFT_2517649 [Fusarium oxysporum]|nr:hypothetical protein QL093DRAFT_2517649 [Fusarium oxysporum]
MPTLRHLLFILRSSVTLSCKKFSSTFRALRPRFPVRPTSATLAAQTTFVVSCRSTLVVIAPSPAALCCLDRPLQLLLPEQYQQPSAA